jgi:glyoxylase-like metal-dependent hydrolase (beta-lactamase superfamily II)
VFKVDRHNEITRIMMGTEINGRIVFSVAAYLFDGLLIDTGCHNTRWELVDYLKSHNVSSAVNTHHHVDHIGANKVIIERLKIPVFAPQESLPIIGRKQDIFPYREALWGCPVPCLVKPLGDTIKTNHYSLQVIQTSGHSKDHVGFFFNERGWLFTGDEFLTDRPTSAQRGEDNEGIEKALKKMLTLEPELLITSSGRIYKDGLAVLRRTIAYLGEMKELVNNMRKSGLASREIVVKLFGGETSLRDFTGGEFSRENFVERFINKKDK